MGANGSGKSNLLKPLAFLSWFCSDSFKSMDNSDELPYYPHMCANDEVSEIEVYFIDKINHEDEYLFAELKYLIKIQNKKLIHEELKLKTSRQFSTVFSRIYNINNGCFDVKVNKSLIQGYYFSEDEIKTVPDNASVISYFKRKKKKNAVTDAMHYIFYSMESNLNMFGKSNFNYNKVLEATQFYEKNPDIFEKAKKYLSRMDLGIDDIVIKKEDVIDKQTGNIEEALMPFGIHKSDDNEFEVNFRFESSGSQACYYFIYKLIAALNYGGVAIIDELDSDLHPYMIKEFIDIFANEGINKHGSQLIFSCHNAEVLKEMNKHNVYLVEKNNGISESWRLDDIKGLRSQDNLYSKYITGALGGVPEINI